MLREIEIDNFRGIDSLKLSFLGADGRPSRIAVLAGPNGCGKTAVLEACLVAAGAANLVRGSTGQAAVKAPAKDFRISASFVVDGALNSVERTASNGKPKQTIIPCGYFSSWRAPRLVGAIPVTAGKKGKRPHPTEENRLWVVKQYLVNARAHLAMSTHMPLFETHYDRVIQNVNAIWQMFYPGKEESFSVEAASDDPDSGFDVYLNKNSGDRISLDALSSGQLELFLLAGSAIPQGEDERILFIDEPELHLDMQWHRLIIRAIMKLRPQCQLIVGTHSPEIYDSVMSYERHYLVADDDPRAKSWLAAVAHVGGQT